MTACHCACVTSNVPIQNACDKVTRMLHLLRLATSFARRRTHDERTGSAVANAMPVVG